MKDLQWWVSSLTTFNKKGILPLRTDMIIESDASTKGWGAFCQGRSAGGPWRWAELKYHINILLELKAAFLALQTFLHNQKSTQVLLLIDNKTAIAYINRKGGTHSKPLSDLAIEIWQWCMARDIRYIVLMAEHIAEKENTRADKESRTFRDPGDWKLRKSCFHCLRQIWGRPEVDLFAARHNHQLPTYYSYRPDPEALAVDAFAQS